jgi:hypothetical protein
MSGHSLSPAQATAFTVAMGVPGIFGFFCPGPLDTTSHPPNLVRQQQAKAIVASLALGCAGTSFTRTPWPFLLSLALVGILMAEYKQHAVRAQPDGQ